MNFALEPVSWSDAERLADLRVQAMRASLEAAGRFDERRARARLLDTYVARHVREIVADGQPVGLIVVRPAGEQLMVDHFYLLPAAQGRGIGSAVLAQVCAQADAAGQAVWVGALKGSRANAFYQRHGFQLVEEAEWDNYYVRPAARAPAHAG